MRMGTLLEELKRIMDDLNMYNAVTRSVNLLHCSLYWPPVHRVAKIALEKVESCTTFSDLYIF